MSVYWFQLRNAFLSRFRYKSNTLWGIFRGAIWILPQYFLWQALFLNKGTVNNVTIEQMITFIFISNLLSQGLSLSGSRKFEERMKSGDICVDLIRPADPRFLFICDMLGNVVLEFLTRGLPVFLVSLIFLSRIMPPASLLHGGLFILSFLLSMTLALVFQLLVAIAAFWFLSVWLMDWVLQFFEGLFSGGIVPLWFMPLWIQHIAAWLPFQAMRFTPIQIYLGKLSVQESFIAIIIQLTWILVLMLIQQLLWQRGIRRIVVLGG